MHQSINDRIKQVREKLKYGPGEFAKALEYDAANWSKVEKGILKFPYSIIEPLVVNFAVNLNWLVTGKGEMFIKKELNVVNEIEEKYGSNSKYIALLEKDNARLEAENKQQKAELIVLKGNSSESMPKTVATYK